MKLRKDKWEIVSLGNYCDIRRGDIITKKTISEGNIPVIASAVGITYYHNKANRTGEIITVSASGVNAGFVNFFNKPIFASDCTTIQPNSDKIDIKFIFNCLSSLQAKIMSFQRGTAQAHVYPKDLISLEIHLPPLEEQQQIAALFQSIDAAIEQVEVQEKNLKALQKSLADGLLKPEPEFGNLLNNKNITSTTFGEIAECDKKYPEHETEVERFVGLEWIEADNFQLQGYGLIANGTTFTKRFAKGDVLFGKRRAYLKKVAIADFDGICSGDILVIRAKAKKMMQALLPFYISSDVFIHHAVSTSAGSLSPRTKWKDLAELEVSIPDLKTQEKILNIFLQLQNTLKQLKQQKTTLQHLKQKLLSEILG